MRRFPRCIVISDEVYEFMTFDGLKHERFCTIDGMFERTISMFSAGKTFSCTGWRVGYALAPAHLTQVLSPRTLSLLYIENTGVHRKGV